MTRNAEWDDEPIRIVSYDPSWPARFEAEKALLEPSIGSWATGGIHHVGSTAVSGLAAKPVIDILVGVDDLLSSRACFGELAKLDYQYAPYRTDEMHWFCKPDPSHRTHHLHLVPPGSRRYHDELAFRDILRARPKIASEYAALKRALADEHRNDREGYTEAKVAFIRRALRESEVDDLVHSLTDWAVGQPAVRALGLVGSWARGDATAASDVDLLMLADQPSLYTSSNAWLNVLDQPTVVRVVRSDQFGVIAERRVRLESGLEVEFGIGPLSWAGTYPIDPGTRTVIFDGLRVLHDPDGLLARLQADVSLSESERSR